MWERAVTNFDQAIELDHENIEAYYTRGNAYHKLGELQRAIADYSRTLELQPGFVPALSDRGTAYFDLGMPAQALIDFNEALRLDSGYLNACTGRGLIYIMQGNYEAAVADFGHALEIDPDNPMARFNHGLASLELGKYDEAINDFTQSIEYDPYCTNQCEIDYYNRGNAYNFLGDHGSAIADYTFSIKQNPSFTPAYLNRGMVYAEQLKNDLALADLNTYVNLNGGEASADVRRMIAELERTNVMWQPGDFDVINLFIGAAVLLAGVDLLIHFRQSPVTTTSSPEGLKAERTRGKVLSILLILGILSGLSTANYWFGSILSGTDAAQWIAIAYGFIGLAKTVSALAMWNWRKWGFYLLITACVLNGLVILVQGLPVVWAFTELILLALIWGRLRTRWIYFT